LLELWLRSRIREISMWDHLQKLMSRWTHRLTVIIYWNATTYALTQRVLRLLYGPAEGTDTVFLSMYGRAEPVAGGPAAC